MNNKTLAIKYRPKVFTDVVEQNTIKIILKQQLKTNTVKNAYLFCGPAGDGKTTTARIFANEINKGQGNPIEMDAASNNSVDDIRKISTQAQTKSLDSEYKVFILDECHVLSNQAWQAMLKLIEEPPAKTIFIFCTTDPQKIPKTILSRVQRYNFQRITYNGIYNRLKYVCTQENINNVDDNALKLIAKLADGGMRDALTYLDKCISYNDELTVDSVSEALGIVSYDSLIALTDNYIFNEQQDIINNIEALYLKGTDLKSFVKSWLLFILDIKKYILTSNFDYISIPQIYEAELNEYKDWHSYINELLQLLVKLNADIKYEQNPKSLIECYLLLGGHSSGWSD